MKSNWTLQINISLALILLVYCATPVNAFPWGLLSKLGSAAGKAGAGAAKAGAGAAKAGAAAKVGGVAAKVGVGKAATMTGAGALAGDAAMGGQAASRIGGVADDMVVGGRAAAAGSFADDGGRAAAAGSLVDDAGRGATVSGEAATEVPMGKFNTRRTRGPVVVEEGAEAGSEGHWVENTVDGVDAASNVASYGEDDESGVNEEVDAPGNRGESIFMMLFGLSLLGIAIHAVTKRVKRKQF